MVKKKPIIAICSSVSFYKDVLAVQKEVKKLGFHVLIPTTARKMAKTGNFDPSYYKTWYKDPSQFHIKKHLMDEHFKKIKRSDAILVINLEKNNIKGYIGGNVLMEITASYLLKKPVFLWNAVDETNAFMEELHGMGVIAINQNPENIMFSRK